MHNRRCCRCHEVIEPLEDFFSQDGEDSDEVYCTMCVDIQLEHEWFGLDLKEKAEMLGYGVYYDGDPDDEDPNAPIPGQIDIFGGVVNG